MKESNMSTSVGYVVLYVHDVNECRDFWVNRVGMIERSKIEIGAMSLYKVGFSDQDFSFELVPLDLMKDNPDGLDLATPSIAFHVDNLVEFRSTLEGKSVTVSEIVNRGGRESFAFSDNENRWFAVLASS
jgi:lactoylglutathione lyase